MLKEYYTFKYISNDFFRPKPRLPEDPLKIRTMDKFLYLITDNSIAKKFMEQAKYSYDVRFPIPRNIMIANPTNKSDLPENSQDIQYLNITIPINTITQLKETAKLLRTQYYFNKIPDH